MLHIEQLNTLNRSRYENKRTLVFSSGLGGLGSFWSPQIDLLKERYELVLYDQRGTGYNAGRLPDGYTIQDMAFELSKSLAKKGIYQYEVIGHALGGQVAMQLALDYPENISQIVVVNGFLKLDSHTERCFEVRQNLLNNAGVESWIRSQPIFLYPANWISENKARVEADDLTHLTNFQGIENLSKRVQALKECDYTLKAKDITKKVLVVCSKDDILIPCNCSKELYESLPNADLEEFSWGGHALNITNSRRFNERLLNWLEKNDPSKYTK
jgi:aminoacrylate hydrolase